jgi:hypothetical protein
MTRDDIIRMAREAGFELNMWQLSVGCEATGTHEELERFAALVAVQVEATWQNRYLKLMDLMQIREGQPNKPCCLAEREACANVCEILAWNQDSTWKAATMDCAAAIRARGQE